MLKGSLVILGCCINNINNIICKENSYLVIALCRE